MFQRSFVRRIFARNQLNRHGWVTYLSHLRTNFRYFEGISWTQVDIETDIKPYHFSRSSRRWVCFWKYAFLLLMTASKLMPGKYTANYNVAVGAGKRQPLFTMYCEILQRLFGVVSSWRLMHFVPIDILHDLCPKCYMMSDFLLINRIISHIINLW